MVIGIIFVRSDQIIFVLVLVFVLQIMFVLVLVLVNEDKKISFSFSFSFTKISLKWTACSHSVYLLIVLCGVTDV
jgi:hypothetical protein